MKFAALGRTQLLFESVKRCMARHQLVLVGTAPASPESTVGETDFARLAHAAGCGFFTATRLDPGHVDLLRRSGAEVAITVNWPTMLPAEAVSACPAGVVNAHAGDLPRYRGNACPNWAILAGEARIVAALHRVDEMLDSGPILATREYPLTHDTYIGDVYRFLEAAVPEMFSDVLDRLESGVEERPQQGAPLRCFPRLPADNEIDWTRPAEWIARQVRAAAEPFSGGFTFLDGERLTVWRATAGRLPYDYHGIPGSVVERRQTGEVVVLAGDGVVVLEEVSFRQAARQRAAAVIRSTRARLGLDAASEILSLRNRVEALEALVRRLSGEGV